MDLSVYHGKRLVVILDDPAGQRRVLKGTAAYQKTAAIGAVMRVQFDEADQQPGSPVLLIQEDHWSEAIRVDRRYGCDYSIRLRRRAKNATGLPTGSF